MKPDWDTVLFMTIIVLSIAWLILVILWILDPPTVTVTIPSPS